MVTVIGEVLIDEFPDYSRPGGAPFNFAANLQRLGQPVRMVTRIGADAAGDRIAATFSAIGLDAAGLQTDPEKATGRVEVSWQTHGRHSFRILPDVAFDRIEPVTPDPNAQLVYFGTLAQRTPAGFDAVQKVVSSHPESAMRFLDINLRPDGYTTQVVERSLAQADVLKLNDEEWAALHSMLAPSTPPADLACWLMERFDIGLIALTRGAAGAELFCDDGRHCRMAAPEVPEIIDTVGAGDGFAAVLAAGLLQRRALERVLKAATEFAAAVCTIAGALPDDDRWYQAAAATMGGNTNAG